jgi:hypothetical protein
MASSGMLPRVALVRTDVSEERSTSIIRVTRIGKLRTTLASTNNRPTLRKNSVRRLLVTANVVPSSPIFVTLMKEVLSSSNTSVLTTATRRNIAEDSILHIGLFFTFQFITVFYVLCSQAKLLVILLFATIYYNTETAFDVAVNGTKPLNL